MSSQPLLIGISGPSSSGKTTLSRHLRDILPNCLILHEDDFYLPDAEIPIVSGLQDWDSLSSLDLPALRSALHHLRAHGTPPPELESKEDRNAVGQSNADTDVLADLKRRAAPLERPVVIVDGFLLFAEEMPDIRSSFDVRLFLRTDYATAKRRREARKGYVTIEGFWEDPPGYVDKIVWPNYVRDHSFLFEGGDVEGGELDTTVLERLDINAMPKGAQGDMTKCVDWAFGILEKELTKP